MFGLSYCYRDVDLNASRIDVWKKKAAKMLNAYFSPIFFFFFVDVRTVGGSLRRRESQERKYYILYSEKHCIDIISLL